MSRSGCFIVIALIALISIGTVIFAYKPTIYTDHNTPVADKEIKTFNSMGEFIKFIRQMRNIASKEGIQVLGPEIGFPISRSIPPPAVTDISGAKTESLSYGSDITYSKTNVQVEGVDEPDILKNDGRYLYLVRNGQVYIVNAYPPENIKVVSELTVNGSPIGIFIYNDKLIVFSVQYSIYKMLPLRESNVVEKPQPPVMEAKPRYPNTTIYIFDISNREEPKLKNKVTIDGVYTAARLIDNYVYMITQATLFNETEIPRITYKGIFTVNIKKIHYVEIADYMYNLVIVSSLNLDNGEFNYESFLLPVCTSTIYVSRDNIYVTAFDWGHIKNGQEYTIIYRIHIGDGKISVDAYGTVPGTVLNQFSMDEYNGYFRIATTVHSLTDWSEMSNSIYILNMTLDIVGKLENIAVGERIYAVRFMGDLGFIVTYRIIDPLFVIDLHDPSNPQIVGELKIPGFSCYLHPLENNLLIGVGREADELGRVMGIKISIFNIENVSNPIELDKIVLGEHGDTPVLYDHKAFLFYPEKNLIFLPVTIYNMKVVNEEENEENVLIKSFWQGIVSIYVGSDGLKIMGNISHIRLLSEGQSNNLKFNYNYYVDRCAYIGNYLYVMSNTYMTVHSLDNYELIAVVNLTG